MKDLQGKNAILAGGSRGIGTYIARALAREGVNLALAGRSVDQLKSVAGEVAKLSLRAIAIPADVIREADRAALVERAQEELGQIDILINNAGIDQYTRFWHLTFAVVKADKSHSPNERCTTGTQADALLL